LSSSRPIVGQSALYAIVEVASLKIGFKLPVNRLRVLPVKPQSEFFALLRRESVYCPFGILQTAFHLIPFVP